MPWFTDSTLGTIDADLEDHKITILDTVDEEEQDIKMEELYAEYEEVKYRLQLENSENAPDIEEVTKVAPKKKAKPLKGKIVLWNPKPEDQLAQFDGKIFYIRFEKVFHPDSIGIYDKFFIKKTSYENQLDTITRYINFFMTFYDQEHEMASNYLKIKFAIDKKKMFTEENPEQLIDLIYEVFFTDSIIEKIKKLVDDNYLDDIESSDDSKKYAKKEKKHLESLEFTNQQIKILLRISFAMKCIAPITLHYAFVNKIKIDKDSDLIYNFYRRLFDILTDPDVNIYNKLFTYVKAKVLESKSHNSVIFEQRDIMGVDEYTVISQFLRKVLISENMIKYRFSENWDPATKKYKENVIGFNKTILKCQLNFFIKAQYSKNFTEVTSAKNSDGLSGMDKMEMNLQKLDEGRIIFANVDIEYEIARIKRDHDFDITEEEIDYYIKNHCPNRLQIEIVYAYWGKYFGSSKETALINRRNYIILMLTLKKLLLLRAGYSHDSTELAENTKLPYIISGNVQDRVNTRIIRNSRYVSKLEESDNYRELNENKYSYLNTIRPDFILSILSQFNNTIFTYVVYEDPSLLGKVIEHDEDKTTDELAFLLRSI